MYPSERLWAARKAREQEERAQAERDAPTALLQLFTGDTSPSPDTSDTTDASGSSDAASGRSDGVEEIN